MSKYTHCRTCQQDLGSNQKSFGMYECCCNRGYCLKCCNQLEEENDPPDQE